MEENNYTFPQANDLDNVVTIMSIDDPILVKKKGHVSHILGDITERQVDYYVSACVYLGFLLPDRSFTPYGMEVLSLPHTEKIVEIARRIVSDFVFGSVYFTQRMIGAPLDKNDVIDIMKLHTKLSDSVYERRAQTVIRWVEWIDRVFPDFR